MAIKRLLEGFWQGLKRIDEDPGHLLGGMAVVLLLAVLTLSASAIRRPGQSAEPHPMAGKVDVAPSQTR